MKRSDNTFEHVTQTSAEKRYRRALRRLQMLCVHHGTLKEVRALLQVGPSPKRAANKGRNPRRSCGESGCLWADTALPIIDRALGQKAR